MSSDSEDSERKQRSAGQRATTSRPKKAPVRFREPDEEEEDNTISRRHKKNKSTRGGQKFVDEDDEDVKEDDDDDSNDDLSLFSSGSAGSTKPPHTSHFPTNPFGLHAALFRAYPEGFPSQMLLEELKWQNRIKGAESAAIFRTEALLSQDLVVFGFIQPNDFTISLLHSPATYHTRGGSGPLIGKDIGFVGDRGEFSTPISVILHPVHAWTWISKTIQDNEGAVEEHFVDPKNKHIPYTPKKKTGLLTQHQLPRLILIPSILVGYCAQGPRTPYELYCKVKALCSAPQAAVARAEADLLKIWCLAACHADAGKVRLAFTLDTAHDNSPTFGNWVQTRLTATLGPRVPLVAVPTLSGVPTPARAGVQDLQHLSMVAAEFGKGVLQALRPASIGIGGDNTLHDTLGGGGATYRGDEAGKAYDRYHYAVIKGFSNCTDMASIQPIWGLFAQTKSFETQRLTIKDSMIAWARRYNVTINRGIFLTKSTIDDFINLRFNPSGGVAYYATAEKGMSILLCRPRAGDEREQATAHEIAEGASNRNRTFAEALALNKRDPRPPPETYHDLKAVVGTFCSLLWTFFGDKCEYFRKLFEIYCCLDSDTVSEKWHFFTPLLCRQIVWAILDDGREYFAQTMLPDKLEVASSATSFIRYPVSSLEELIRPIRNQVPIYRANFPTQWITRTDTRREAPARQGAASLIGGDTAPPVTFIPRANAPAFGSTAHSTASSITGAATTSPSTISRAVRTGDIHPTIKAMMTPFMTRIGRLQITRIMALANTTWNDMPKIQKYMSADKNGLCYNYVLGKCNPRYCTHRTGHAAVADISDEFADTLCTLLKPGINAMTEALAAMPWLEFKTFLAGRPDQSRAE